MVGSRRLELPTSSVSRKRSNQLSYEPENTNIPQRLICNSRFECDHRYGLRPSRNTETGVFSSDQICVEERMPKKKNPMEESLSEARKNANRNTRGKNAAGQTQGQFEQDQKRKAGQFTQAGEPPLMKK